MTEQDLVIQELRAENAKLKERLEEQSKPTEPTDMDKLTTEMMEHICDNICMHPIRVGQTQDELDDICAECRMGKFVCDILNTYNRLNDFDKTQSYDLLKKLSEYRNLEEQGLLKKQLYKEGQLVWCVDEYEYSGLLFVGTCGEYVMVVPEFVNCATDFDRQLEEMCEESQEDLTNDIKIYHKDSVYSTRTEAQAVLEKMKGE